MFAPKLFSASTQPVTSHSFVLISVACVSVIPLNLADLGLFKLSFTYVSACTIASCLSIYSELPLFKTLMKKGEKIKIIIPLIVIKAAFLLLHCKPNFLSFLKGTNFLKSIPYHPSQPQCFNLIQ